MANEHKTERIEARTSPANRALIEQAAILEGRSISDYIISMASEAAKKTIAEHNLIQLSQADQIAFAESLLNPKPITDALRRAKALHAEMIEPS